MKNKTLNDFKCLVELDPKNINKVYDDVISLGIENFNSLQDYSDTIYFLIRTFVYFNDYLHSNNLLQLYRLNILNSNNALPDWYRYYSIKIYSKRSIKYYLDNPFKFWETVNELANSEEDFISRLDGLVIDTLEFYKKEYICYPEFLHDSFLKFINYSRTIRIYSPSIKPHLKEMVALSKANNKEEAIKIYEGLESKRNLESALDYENLFPGSSEAIKEKIAEKEAEIVDTYYGEIVLDDDLDQQKKILIIGDDKFLHNESVIYEIAHKEFNLNKDGIEILNDYEKIKKLAEDKLRKTVYNDKYIGIIFGSCPHSTTAKGDYSSMLSKCQSEQGYPKTVVCSSHTDGGKLKVTKTSFRNALREIILDYKTK